MVEVANMLILYRIRENLSFNHEAINGCLCWRFQIVLDCQRLCRTLAHNVGVGSLQSEPVKLGERTFKMDHAAFLQ